MKTGLFLGAGASVDFELPLVWDLTDELRSWLTPLELRKINEESKADGNGYSEAIVEEFVELLNRKEMHYEAILGNLQVQRYRARANPELFRSYGALYHWFARVVSEILIEHSTR